MSRILIAEDSLTQAIAIRTLLEKAGHDTRSATDGEEALEAVRADPPEILLTDMNMPKRNGLELTELVRAEFPDVPVVLMTAEGSEELAADALARGASNYIPKSRLNRDLVSTIDGISAMVTARKKRTSVLSALTHAEATYTCGNDREFASTLVAQFESDLQHVEFDDGTGMFRIVTALKEALLNAIDHGNLELDSDLRDEGKGDEYYKLGEERLTQEPYCYRKVTVTMRLSPEQLSYVIRDDGPGFDPSTLPDPEDPESIMRAHGRGLLLIRSFMDDVVFNEKGNQITLIKYRVDPCLDTSDEPPILHTRPSLRILLAEDVPTSQVLAKSLLEHEGHVVTVASNGLDAVRLSEEEEFDLILMDLEMPKMDGLTATRKIRLRDESKGVSTPIIAMTSHAEPDDVQRCLDAGMQTHISKPVQAEILNAALADL